MSSRSLRTASVPPFSALHEGHAGTRFAPSSPLPEDVAHTLSDSVRLKNLLGQKTGAFNEPWFSPLFFALEQGPVLRIECPHPLFYRWFSQTGRPLLEQAARDLLGNDVRIVYGYASGTEERGSSLPAPSEQYDGSEKACPSFEEFLISGRNRDTLRLFRRALQGTPCTILLLGPSGTGKSHLLHAASAELRPLRGDVLFLTCGELIARFRQSPDRTRRSLMAASAVLLDDIQFLEQHTDLQLELAALLDSGEGKTFFLASYQTSDKDGGGDRLLPALYDRLCSQLALGLTEPDLDVRLRFAQECMRKAGLPEHRTTALTVARRCPRLRHIRGVLEQTGRRYEQNGMLPSAEEFSAMIGRSGAPQPPDAEHILAVVASRYGCSSAQLCENTREKNLTLPRQIAMFLCRDILGESYPSLGLIFGGKDHSTVMYAVKKIEKMKVTNKDMHIQLTELTRQCRNSAFRRE